MNVTTRQSIEIRAEPERVWDFTQDWTQRMAWDPAISAVEILPGPERRIRVRAGGTRFLVRYKLFDRPHRTSLAMTESSSRIVTGGGGSWDYAAEGEGTRFTQQNTLVLHGPLAPVLAPLVRWQLDRLTRRALANAKRLLEGP